MSNSSQYKIEGDSILYKIKYASSFHIKQVYIHLPEIEYKKRSHNFYSIDKGFLLGNFTLLAHRNFFSHWHFDSAKICLNMGFLYNRVIPILDRQYTNEEIEEIKYTLHVLLSLGCVIHLPIVNRIDYLESRFGENNFVTIENRFTIKTRHVWDKDKAVMELDYNKDNIELFNPFNRSKWREENNVLSLRYRRNTFTAGVTRNEPIKRYYGDFLYFIQSKKCAISGIKLDIQTMQIDHIYPTSKGGTNTLINLQAVDPIANKNKSDDVDESERRIWDDKTLVRKGFDLFFPYRQLTYRNVSENPFGFLLL